MKGKIFAVVVALVATQLLSGCYMLRELDWSKDKVGGGETSKARIGTIGTNSIDSGRIFVMGVFQTEGFKLKGAKWDTKGALGNTKKLVRDDELLELAASNDGCFGGVAFRRGPGSAARLYRTKGLAEESTKFVDASLKAKAPNGNDGDVLVGIVATGIWIDDGDKVPEDPESSDDEISCSGSSTTFVQKKGPTSMREGLFETARNAFTGE